MAYVIYLSVTSYSTSDSDQSSINFQVQCNKNSWTVTKTSEDVAALLDAFPELVSCSGTNTHGDSSTLAEKLVVLYETLAETAWERPEAIDFIRDAAQKSTVSDLQTLQVKAKIVRMEKQLLAHEQMITSFVSQQKAMAELVAALTKQVQENHASNSDSDNSSLTDSGEASRCASTGGDSSASTTRLANADEFEEVVMTKDSGGLILPHPHIRDYHSSDGNYSSASSSRETRPSSDSCCSGDSRGTDVSPVEQNKKYLSLNDIGLNALASKISNTTDGSYTDSSVTRSPLTAIVENARELFSRSKDCAAAHIPKHIEIINEMLDSIRPHQNQLEFRRSAAGLIFKSVRQTLAVNTFDVSYGNIHAFLPDDPIKLSVIVCRAQADSWHLVLMDRLRLYSAGGNGSAGLSALNSTAEDNDTSLALIPDEYRVVLSHALSNISSSTTNMQCTVRCTVDDSLEVHIMPNNRHDLCELSFVEEFNSLIGKNDLFKRSLLLVRAWWVYEATNYVGCPVKHYLSDSTILVMLCSIFNRNHKEIVSPVQALCAFLAEYAAYDGANQVISMQGICSFATPSSTQPILLPVESTHILSLEAMNKYQHVFNPQGTNGGSSSFSSHRFERFNFNVAHPFTGENMIPHKLSDNRAHKMSLIFRTGLSNFVALLKQSGDLKVFFKSTMIRFESHWRPDAIGNSINSSDGHSRSIMASLTVPSAIIDRIWQNILYCDLVLESVVTEQALLTLCIEILTLKGALPVGEIGKFISETTNIVNMSVKLKEKFGGLKKFVERFTDIFVFSNEHPFNPHVLLKSTLSAEDHKMIDSGRFPLQPAGSKSRNGNPTHFGAQTQHSFVDKQQQQQQHRKHTATGSASTSSPPLSLSVSPAVLKQKHNFLSYKFEQENIEFDTDIDIVGCDGGGGGSGSRGAGGVMNINSFSSYPIGTRSTVSLTAPTDTVDTDAMMSNGYTRYYPKQQQQQQQQQQHLPLYDRKGSSVVSTTSISSDSGNSGGRIQKQQQQQQQQKKKSSQLYGMSNNFSLQERPSGSGGQRGLPRHHHHQQQQLFHEFPSYGGGAPLAGESRGGFGEYTSNSYNNYSKLQPQEQQFREGAYYLGQSHQMSQPHQQQEQEQQSPYSGYSHF